MIFSSYLFVLPAFAVGFSSSASFDYYVFDGSSKLVEQRVFLSVPLENSSYSHLLYSFTDSSPLNFRISAFSNYYEGTFDGSLGIYLSYFLETSFPASISTPSLSSYHGDVEFLYSDGAISSVPLPSSSFSTFPIDRVEGGSAVSSGRLIKARINFDSIASVSRVFITLQSDGSNSMYSVIPDGNEFGSVYLRIPSFVFVSGLSSSVIDDLEGIADSIASQSEILAAMYGDIMSILSDMYNRLGSIESTLNLANIYFSQMIPLLDSISTSNSNIYSLLQSQFQLLRTLIATESGNIQDAIEQQTDDLIAYFDSVFADSVGSVPEKSDDLQTSVDDYDSAESQYQSNAAARFDELVSTFSGFSGGTLSGITLASNLFSRVWNALGSYNIVYLYPLILGMCLVVIGRLGKTSGGQSSAEKHRGDSSA